MIVKMKLVETAGTFSLYLKQVKFKSFTETNLSFLQENPMFPDGLGFVFANLFLICNEWYFTQTDILVKLTEKLSLTKLSLYNCTATHTIINSTDSHGQRLKSIK